MNLQYLSNNNPPPTQSVLQYKVDPDTVFVSTATEQMYANLTITVFNPQSSAVTCQSFQFGFHVGAKYGDLTASASGIQTSSDQNDWKISTVAAVNPDDPTLYQFSAPPSGEANRQLAPNQSLVFHLDGILINQAVGEGGAPFVITEVTGERSNPSVVQGQITITKEKPRLSAQLSVDPPRPITPGQSVTLHWQVTGSDHWQLYDYDTDTLLYDSETSAPKNALSFGPLSPQQNTNYELIAFAGQLSTTAYAEAMVVVPSITHVTSPDGPVDALTEVVIGWTSVHAATVTLEPGDQTADASSGAGQFKVKPGGNTTYALTPYNGGYKGAPFTVLVSVNPPQIKCFTASTSLPPPGQAASLSWETVSASSASVRRSFAGQLGIINLGSVDVQSAGYPVYPKGISTYILTAKVDDGRQAQAEVMVAENAGTFPVGKKPWALAFDGTHIWVVNSDDDTLSVLKASDGTLAPFPQNPIPVHSAIALAFDGTHVWATRYSDNNVIVLKASDGTLAPFPRNPVPVGNGPGALLFDGTYIWVANSNDNNVSVLKASDGSLATFPRNPVPVGSSPEALAFDGTHIWVMNAFGNNVSVLKASDGTLAPFPRNPVPVGNAPIAMAFDGTHIWVANTEDNTLTVLNASDGSLAPFPQNPITGHGPAALASDGTYMWVANANVSTLSVFKASDGSLARCAQNPFPVGNDPEGLVFDGTYIWVANKDSNTVTKL